MRWSGDCGKDDRDVKQVDVTQTCNLEGKRVLTSLHARKHEFQYSCQVPIVNHLAADEWPVLTDSGAKGMEMFRHSFLKRV